MAGPAGGNFKFLKNFFLVGFGAFAAALFLQRKEINKYGYDIHLTGLNINEGRLADMIGDNGEPVDPADDNQVKLSQTLADFRNAGMTPQVYLARAKNIADINIAKIRDVPMLVKCDDGQIYAFLNQRSHANVQMFGAMPQDGSDRGQIYNGLNFPKQYFSFPDAGGRPPHKAVKNILSQAVVDDLTANHQHLHISKHHAHKDTRMDNRFLIIKNERRAAVPPNSPPGTLGRILPAEYYRYYQDKKGEYVLKFIGNAGDVPIQTLLQGINYADAKPGKVTHVKRDKGVVNRLLAAAYNDDIAADGSHPHTMAAAADQRRFTVAELEKYEARNKQALMMFSGALAATEVPSLMQQAKSSGTYALMNAMTAASKEGKSIKDGLAAKIAPIRNALNI